MTRRPGTALDRAYDATVFEPHLSKTQWYILAFVHRNDGGSPTEIRDGLEAEFGVDRKRQTISAALIPLRDDEDLLYRRGRGFYRLTDRGEKFANDIVERIDDAAESLDDEDDESDD